MLSDHICLGLARGLLLYSFILSLICATCSAPLILLDFTINFVDWENFVWKY